MKTEKTTKPQTSKQRKIVKIGLAINGALLVVIGVLGFIYATADDGFRTLENNNAPQVK